jgi:hypothetical protein
MRKLGTVLSLVAGLALVSATPAFANGLKTYRICGGDTFTSCAAVEVSVVGRNVTLRVWNLAGNAGATYNQANGSLGIIGAIGFYNLPAGVQLDPSSLSVNGGGQGGWQLRNMSGGFALDGRSGPGQMGTGIGSGCSANTTATQYTSPCTGLGNSANWVTFNFQVNRTFDPRTSDISVLSFDPSTGRTSENWTGTLPNGSPGIATTVTPEPVTMTMLATGLAGLSGAGFLRRRKRKSVEA